MSEPVYPPDDCIFDCVVLVHVPLVCSITIPDCCPEYHFDDKSLSSIALSVGALHSRQLHKGSAIAYFASVMQIPKLTGGKTDIAHLSDS